MEVRPRNVETYVAPNDTSPFDEWIGELKDLKGRAIIEARINKLRRGILGEWGTVGDGIIELIITFGPGYRVYCVDDGTNVLILCAGRKRAQRNEIRKAKAYWKEFNS